MDTSTLISAQCVAEFQNRVWGHYKSNRRMLPWRVLPTPYHVFIAEFMLQQSQPARAITRFAAFVRKFPDFCALAAAHPEKIKDAWRGLGYSHKAKQLQQSARIICEHGGNLPAQKDFVCKLPGMGQRGAGVVLACAFNEPAIVESSEILSLCDIFLPDNYRTPEGRRLLLAASLPVNKPREWQWALEDYAAFCKSNCAYKI